MKTYYLVIKGGNEVITNTQVYDIESALIYFATVKKLSIPDLLSIFDVVDKVN